MCVIFLLIITTEKKKEGTVLFILLLHFLAHSFQLSFHGLDLFQEFGTLILLVELNLSQVSVFIDKRSSMLFPFFG